MMSRLPLCALLLLASSCTPPQADEEVRARPVGGDISREQIVEDVAIASGQLRGANDAEIKAGASGTVSSLPVFAGETVDSGDLIATLNQAAVRGPVGFRDFRVLAPIGGYVSQISVSLGDFVPAQSTIGRIVEPGDLQADISVSERFGGKVTVGDRVVFDPLGAVEPVVGEVVAASRVADPITRDIDVRVKFAETLVNAAVGQYGDFRIVVDERPMLTIPQEALNIDDISPYVYVVDPESMTANRVDLTIDESIETEDNSVVVLDGLDPGRFVVTRGNIADGDVVRIRQSPADQDPERDRRVAQWEAETRGEPVPERVPES